MDSDAAETRILELLKNGDYDSNQKSALEAFVKACDNERKGIPQERWE